MKKLEVLLCVEKETKNTIRFEEVLEEGEFPVVRNLYIQKPHFEQLGKPQRIKLTIIPEGGDS